MALGKWQRIAPGRIAATDTTYGQHLPNLRRDRFQSAVEALGDKIVGMGFGCGSAGVTQRADSTLY